MGKPDNWTEIELNDDTSNDIDSLVLDLEEKPNYGKQKEIFSSNGPRETVNETKKTEDEDKEDFSQRLENKGFRKAPQEAAGETELEDIRPKPNRAHKRIKNLLGERQELTQIVNEQQKVIEELSKRVKGSERQNISSQKEQWERAVEMKEKALEQAMSDNDPRAVASATKELADAQMKYSAMKAVEDDFDDTPDVPKLPEVRRQAEPPEAAKEWVERNPWFFKDQKQHVLARTLSLELTNEGKLDPESDEYWDEMDRRLATYNIKTGKRDGAVDESEQQPQQQQQSKRKGSPISSSRSSGDDDFDTQFTRKGNRVSASPTQNDIDMAERLGINLNDYMREKFKYSNQNYKGYVPIDIT